MTGTVLLTFDDRFVASWGAAAPLLDAYDARVTFFVREPDLLDDEEVHLLRGLAAGGHTVGAHGLRHRDAVERTDALGPVGYLAEDVEPCVAALADALGEPPRCFAYPMSRRDERTDDALLGVFALLRSGVRRTGRRADAAGALVPPGPLPPVLPGLGIDTGRHGRPPLRDEDVLDALLVRAAEGGGTLTLYAHEVADAGPENFLPPARLASVLRRCRALGLRLRGFDDVLDRLDRAPDGTGTAGGPR